MTCFKTDLTCLLNQESFSCKKHLKTSLYVENGQWIILTNQKALKSFNSPFCLCVPFSFRSWIWKLRWRFVFGDDCWRFLFGSIKTEDFFQSVLLLLLILLLLLLEAQNSELGPLDVNDSSRFVWMGKHVVKTQTNSEMWSL